MLVPLNDDEPKKRPLLIEWPFVEIRMNLD